MSEKVNVIVTIKCKENLKSKVIEAFDIAVEKTRKEKGCLTYRLLENSNSEDELIVLEEWENRESLMAHTKQPHFKELNVTIKNFVQESSFKFLSPKL